MQYEHNPHLSQAYSDPAGKSSALAGLAPPPHPKILDPPLDTVMTFSAFATLHRGLTGEAIAREDR